jgi:NAD(P)-dependent dehydrogenase (short-subunit alcohol dehydrogenase family)
MRILIIGGTRFIGPRAVKQFIEGGPEVTVFHRGQTDACLPATVSHVYGDRSDLANFTPHFKRLAPDVVLDLICYNAQDASGLMKTFTGVTRRVVVASSMDVYRAYGCLLGIVLSVLDDRAAGRIYNIGEPDALTEAEWVR